MTRACSRNRPACAGLGSFGISDPGGQARWVRFGKGARPGGWVRFGKRVLLWSIQAKSHQENDLGNIQGDILNPDSQGLCLTWVQVVFMVGSGVGVVPSGRGWPSRVGRLDLSGVTPGELFMDPSPPRERRYDSIVVRLTRDWTGWDGLDAH